MLIGAVNIGKRLIEEQKLEFEKEKWNYQLKIDEKRIGVEEKKIKMDKEKVELEFCFQREEKEKDRVESQTKDKLNLAIACINSGCSLDDIERISQILGLK